MSTIYDTHKPAAPEGSGLYLKIADGDTVKLRLASDPAIFETENERDDPDNPGHKKTQISTRYAWLVWNQDTKQAQVLQQSATFFRSIAALAQDSEWGDPTQYDIKISRKGVGLETTYSVLPSANREPLNSEAREAIAKIDLVDKLKASQFNQRVMWLSDWDNLDRGQSDTQPAADPEPTADDLQPKKKDDVVIEDIGDDPINLDDIPF